MSDMLFWIELVENYQLFSYHPVTEDKTEQYENYSPCSDKPQFWPPLKVTE